MTILVTGATGLVGARLLLRLVETGLACRALMRHEGDLPEGVTTVKGDLLDTQSLAGAVDAVSAIIHLAAVFRTTDEDLVWKSNLEGTQNLIAAAQGYAPNARFIMASTTNIYDVDSARPSREDDVANPKLAYPASKLEAENELRRSGLNWSIQRFGFVYGNKDGHLESLPKHMATFKWHPAQRMSMIHHEDIANAMLVALTGAMDGRIVNIVDEAPMSIYELIELVGGAMEPSSEPLANPWRLCADGALARCLGFRPIVRTVHQAVQDRLL